MQDESSQASTSTLATSHTGLGSSEAAQAKALLFVAQSSAMAIQDAVENLRSVNTISATAMGAAMAHMLSTGDINTFAQILQQATTMQTNSMQHFQSVAKCAADLVRDFAQVSEVSRQTLTNKTPAAGSAQSNAFSTGGFQTDSFPAGASQTGNIDNP